MPLPEGENTYTLGPGSDEAHVDTPDEADEVEEDDALLDGDAAEADDGGKGPDLVAGDDDRNGLGADVLADLGERLPLQQAHDNEEGDRIEDGAQRDAVDEPLGHGVAQVQSRLLPLLLLLSLPELVSLLFSATIDVELTDANPQILLLRVHVGGRRPVLVGWEGALEELLPVVVRGRGNEGENDEAQELSEVECEGLIVPVCLKDLSEDVGGAGEGSGGHRGLYHLRRHYRYLACLITGSESRECLEKERLSS